MEFVMNVEKLIQKKGSKAYTLATRKERSQICETVSRSEVEYVENNEGVSHWHTLIVYSSPP